jgi:hypothetical protein
MNQKQKAIPCVLSFFISLLRAQAGVTTLAWYRLGESDRGAANGLPVTNSTADLTGVFPLAQIANPIYTNST